MISKKFITNSIVAISANEIKKICVDRISDINIDIIFTYESEGFKDCCLIWPITLDKKLDFVITPEIIIDMINFKCCTYISTEMAKEYLERPGRQKLKPSEEETIVADKETIAAFSYFSQKEPT